MGLTLAMTLIFEFSRPYMILTIWWPRSDVRIYQIVTEVTSVVGVPSTHLVNVYTTHGSLLEKAHNYRVYYKSSVHPKVTQPVVSTSRLRFNTIMASLVHLCACWLLNSQRDLMLTNQPIGSLHQDLCPCGKTYALGLTAAQDAASYSYNIVRYYTMLITVMTWLTQR